MNLMVKKFRMDAKYFMKNNVKVVFSGRRDGLRKDVLDSMDYLVDLTKDNTNGIFNICLNYGSRSEIVDMTKKIAEKYKNNEIDLDDIDEELVSKNLYNDLGDIDFLIRTSGEQRISNFMLWQISYSEIYFPETYFPDFDNKEFDKSLEIYNNRERRFGGVNYDTKTN